MIYQKRIDWLRLFMIHVCPLDLQYSTKHNVEVLMIKEGDKSILGSRDQLGLICGTGINNFFLRLPGMEIFKGTGINLLCYMYFRDWDSTYIFWRVMGFCCLFHLGTGNSDLFWLGNGIDSFFSLVLEWDFFLLAPTGTGKSIFSSGTRIKSPLSLSIVYHDHIPYINYTLVWQCP